MQVSLVLVRMRSSSGEASVVSGCQVMTTHASERAVGRRRRLSRGRRGLPRPGGGAAPRRPARVAVQAGGGDQAGGGTLPGHRFGRVAPGLGHGSRLAERLPAPVDRASDTIPRMSLNLAVILRESARRDPDRVAIILDSFKFTYGQLDALSNQAASSLKAGGLRKGDRVGVMLPNVPQFPIAYFAILKAGGVVVPMNVLLKAPEVSYCMGDSGARYLVAWDDYAGEAGH